MSGRKAGATTATTPSDGDDATSTAHALLTLQSGEATENHARLGDRDAEIQQEADGAAPPPPEWVRAQYNRFHGDGEEEADLLGEQMLLDVQPETFLPPQAVASQAAVGGIVELRAPFGTAISSAQAQRLLEITYGPETGPEQMLDERASATG